ncbi:MAG TPA: HD domain-containing protein, partial [Thermomicrobiales bacterium]|nr:HD domain-containing protein [Thermomicrobiales bacterium]
LKRVKRQGWLDRGVDEPESVADHSWGVALLAWALSSERDDLDGNRVLLLGLVHDLPEALAGDTTPFDSERDSAGLIAARHFERVPEYSEELDRQKRALESDALEEMLAGLSGSLADDIRSAWWEYELAETAEARFVKQIDKLETAMQAERYAREQTDLVLESFRRGAFRDVRDERLLRILESIVGASGD